MTKIETSVIDSSLVQYKLKQAQQAVKKISPNVLSKGIVTYAENASRQMPPPVKGTRSRTIPAKLYKRQVLSIDEMYKKTDKPNVKRFLVHKKIQGFKYCVWVYKDRGRHKRLQFAKTERELKSKWGRIKYRGLYKWLWGANLSKIGEATPTMFSRLLQKSPDLAKKSNLATMYKTQKENETEIVAEYNADGIDYFAKQAKKAATTAMKKKMKKLFRSGLTEEIKKIK